MLEMLKNWYIRRFTDPQAMALFNHFTVLFYCDLFFQRYFSTTINRHCVGIFIGMADPFFT